MDTPCIDWAGRLNRQGYGRIGWDLAHRRAYEQSVGPVPDGMELDHLCRNARCVNPDHLEPVTREENMRRRSEAQTHCKHGHEFTPENTYPRPKDGRRQCRACNREAVRRYKTRKATA